MALVYKNRPPTDWDYLLSQAGQEAGLCQSTYWADVIAEVDRARPMFLQVFQEGDATGDTPAAMLLAFIKTPWDRVRRRRAGRFRDIILQRRSQWLEWHDGPVIVTEDRRAALSALKELLEWLSRFAAANRLSRICSGGFCRTGRWPHDGEAAESFIQEGYSLNEWASLLVDLMPSLEDIWSSISHAARKAVKKAQRSGITIKRMESLEQFQELFLKGYNESERHNRRSELPLHVAKASWQRDTEGYYSYHVAVDSAGSVLGTLGMYIFNGVATEIASSLMPRAMEEKLPAQDLLHWEMLCEARRRGCRTFDLAGISPAPRDSGEAGIRRFKEKWGGLHVEYYRPAKAMPCSVSFLEKALRRSIRLIKR
jgi:hypothetical protein